MSKKVKNILIFSGYHLPHLGGIERYTDNLSKQFKNEGINVKIVSTNYDNLENYEKVNEIENYRIPIFNLFKSRYPLPKINKEYKKIIRELEKDTYDAIIVNTRFHLTSMIGAKYGKKHNVPVFLIEHGSEHLTVDNKVLDYLGSIYEHCLTHFIKKYVDYYYGVSKEACEWQKHFGINSNDIWYNSINDFYKKNIIKSSKKIIVTYAGRVLKQKGIYELLEAFSNLEKKYNNIELHIAGDGNQLEILKERYKNKNIIFEGKLNFDNLINLYKKTNIFVYAPLWPEGLPTSVLEAGYMKCACIGSPQGGIKEIIKHKKNGLMINNQKELEESIELLINDESLRNKYSEEIYITVNKKFLWRETAKKIERDINEKIKTG